MKFSISTFTVLACVSLATASSLFRRGVEFGDYAMERPSNAGSSHAATGPVDQSSPEGRNIWALRIQQSLINAGASTQGLDKLDNPNSHSSLLGHVISGIYTNRVKYHVTDLILPPKPSKEITKAEQDVLLRFGDLPYTERFSTFMEIVGAGMTDWQREYIEQYVDQSVSLDNPVARLQALNRLQYPKSEENMKKLKKLVTNFFLDDDANMTAGQVKIFRSMDVHSFPDSEVPFSEETKEAFEKLTEEQQVNIAKVIVLAATFGNTPSQAGKDPLGAAMEATLGR
ncbi:hypothetical protein FRB99_001944 [Tulasnella sp. 403]|nr:hypothetical protein FRB99_001944 [Tulasnella sp. 403]